MTPRQLRMFEAAAASDLAALGYELGSDVGGGSSPRVGALFSAPFRLHDGAMRGVRLVQLRLVQERGCELPYLLSRNLQREPR